MRTEQARRRLVQRLEQEAQQAPARYRLKLALLALLGYAVMGLALTMTLGVAALLLLYLLIVRPPAEPNIAIPILLLGAIGIVVLRALWFRFGIPDGHLLQPGEAPALRGEVERIGREVGAGRLHGIVINAELNAAAAYVPNGIGGWGQRQYLVLGLPLLQVLDRRELAAVIAHEFGHFHGGHGRFAGWIYRLRSSWYRLLHGMAGSGLSAGHLFGLFFRWYAPYFDAYSFVLARRHEYAADAVAAKVAKADAMAAALVRLGLAADWMERSFWPQVRESAHAQAYPPVQVYGRLGAGLREHRHSQLHAPGWLLLAEPGWDDTHPTLKQRLAALNVPAQVRLNAEPRTSAAESLLGSELAERLEQRFSGEWREAADADWRAHHQRLAGERQRLQELDSRAARAPAEAVEYAGLVEDHRPTADALPLYRQALEQLPSHALGQCRLGALLLKRGQPEEGIQRLQRALDLDSAVAEPALRSLDDYLRTTAEASAAFEAALALRARCAALAREPQADAPAIEADELLPHDLEPGQVQALTRTLGGYEKIARAWVFRKQAAGMSALPHYLLLVDWAGSVASESAGLERLAGQLRLPGSFSVLSATGGSDLVRHLKRQAGDPVYRRRR
ncbi:M48 family metallopeptidase [Pseudoxanthomonas wuyuanensis]|uniref:Zn-dependent protease with chaperone function n=1 Tax=Pseudoxanthomonas wuyuanensis TaxID=1073196 RepID=A0A286D898_9GAMM|nr:M48 family metallopeptidase [Pseudoxanthomonas wuyuanensis]KAF1718838.1 hypothetical protein CSC75_17735 [Pseudoxanthomonas wuyuanensis]SOD54854.1 Zn-dependent protease with chaperone function [Pseudoxanthomonas wuyuanensis]